MKQSSLYSSDYSTEAYVDSHIAEILTNAEKVKRIQPKAVPMAFWDFDGTIIKGDVSEGLVENGEQKYKGLLEETILAGLCTIYKGKEGWHQFIDIDYPRFYKIGKEIAYSFCAKLYSNLKEEELDAFCLQKFEDVYQNWYFSSSVKMLHALEDAGIENYIVSSSPEVFVKNAYKTINLARSRIRGIRVEIDNGHITQRLIYPINYGEGKAEIVKQIISARQNGIAIAGFGDNFANDGCFMHDIVTQNLPGGAKGVTLMINGQVKEQCEFEGLFKCVKQNKLCQYI